MDADEHQVVKRYDAMIERGAIGQKKPSSKIPTYYTHAGGSGRDFHCGDKP